MIEAVATVPHPPLLVDALAGSAAGETAALRTACRRAAADLAAVATRWVAVGSDPCTGVWGPRTRGSFRAFGVDQVVSLGPDADLAPDPDLPLPLLVAGWLRDGVDDPAVTVDGVVLDPDATPAACLRRGAEIAAGTGAGEAGGEPTGLLVLGDGAATHTPRAPGAFDPRAGSYDDAVGDALATADTDALAALEPGLADELWVGGRVAWQLLAGAAGGSGAGRWEAEPRHRSAPFGVAYHVAFWRRLR